MKKADKWINLILILAVVFSCLPLAIPGIEGHFGQDLGFHINRIEGIYLELSRGVFPVRMQSFWMDGYGYPVSIYYGDIFLYLPALLRLMGVPVVAAYKVFLFAVDVATVIAAYYSFSGILCDKKLGAIGAFVYATSNYRLLDLYIRAAVGEYTALIFLPLIAYGVCLLYGWTKDSRAESGKLCREAVIPLFAGMTGILLSHIVTLEIICLCLIVVCALNLKKTFTKRVMLTYMVSAGMTLLATLYFTIPFADYFINESVRINQVVGNARQIQESGTRLYEYFDFFMIPFSNLDPSVSDDRMLTTPGAVLMGTLIAGIAVCLSGILRGKKVGAPGVDRRTRAIRSLTAAGVVLLFISSDIFPWNRLGRSGALGDLLAQVQFPWRYVGIATVVLTLLLLVMMSGHEDLSTGKKYPHAATLVLSVAAAMCVWFAGVYMTYAQLDTFRTTADLDTYDMGYIEYLRPDAVREDFTHEIRVTAGEAEEVSELYHEGTSMDIYVHSESGATIELPILNYRYYHISDGSDKSYAISDGENDEICFDLDAGFDGVIMLRYEPPILWHVAEWISLMFILGFMAAVIVSGRQKSRRGTYNK